MKIVTEIEEANRLLESYTDAELQIAFYSESLKRIAMRIWSPDMESLIYLIGVGCERISGQFRASKMNLLITKEINDQTKESVTKISDKLYKFELLTSGGFSLAQGYEQEFGNSFENFLNESK